MKTSPSPPAMSAQGQGGEHAALRAANDKEKTIPFLRQLTEMLMNNNEIISFVPGQRLPNETINGKIIVHDRHRLQSEVLPFYFNHTSFASLRRQLSYFSFTRVGKSRQSAVAYTNDAIMELPDILRLKRRVVTAPGQAGKAIANHEGGDEKQLARQPKRERASRRAESGGGGGRSGPRERRREWSEAANDAAVTSADVESAVLSGARHAAKTNRDAVLVGSPPPSEPHIGGGGGSNNNNASVTQSSSLSQLDGSRVLALQLG